MLSIPLRNCITISIFRHIFAIVHRHCDNKRAQIDLKVLECEKTHFIKLTLEDGAGTLSLLITITGTYKMITSNELEADENELYASSTYKNEIIKKYVIFKGLQKKTTKKFLFLVLNIVVFFFFYLKGLLNSLRHMEDVGWLQIKVIRAEGLASADINGKSDPFCSLQLINQFARTHTEYKTLNPEWGKTFEL